MTKVDDFTVRVVTPEVFAPFLEFFGSVPVLPKHVLETAVKAKVFPAAYGVGSKPEPDRRLRPISVEGIRPRAIHFAGAQSRILGDRPPGPPLALL